MLSTVRLCCTGDDVICLPLSSKLHQHGAITVHSVVAPSGELRGKGRCGVCLQVKLCDPHLSALEVRFSRRGATQIYVYVYHCHHHHAYSLCLLLFNFIIPSYYTSFVYLYHRLIQITLASPSHLPLFSTRDPVTAVHYFHY